MDQPVLSLIQVFQMLETEIKTQAFDGNLQRILETTLWVKQNP